MLFPLIALSYRLTILRLAARSRRHAVGILRMAHAKANFLTPDQPFPERFSLKFQPRADYRGAIEVFCA